MRPFIVAGQEGLLWRIHCAMLLPASMQILNRRSLGDFESCAARTAFSRFSERRECSYSLASFGYCCILASMRAGMDANVHACIFVNLQCGKEHDLVFV